ncbi:hypothetical protein QQF64_023831 [Cirrhinus molitorella]|uniref:Gypsy retrotransposon integrase-like protein 1 n=1 Tax=Cirrhinus molitorella TaxID=172907 RepID=A0ABR3NJJ2_9TELE
MRDYIKRNNLRKEQQAEEILVHLRGKARDVVRFGIRNSDIDIVHNPDAIFSILRKHFEAAPCSPLPLADFYTTLPRPGEDAYKYWLRLNRAVNIAAERLKEQATVWSDLQLKAMVDSGSVGCTLSEAAERRLLQHKPDLLKLSANNVIIIGCGGQHVTPKVMYELELTVYACTMVVPVLVVPGQTDDLILGSNAIKWLIQKMKETDVCWRLVWSPANSDDVECHQFLSLLSNVERWKGEDMPDKVGTAKLKKKLTLQPNHEHLAWAQLPVSTAVSVGNTVIVEPALSKCRPRNVIIERVITPMWELSTLECLQSNVQCAASPMNHVHSSDERANVLDKLGLRDHNLEACEVSDEWKDRLLDLIEKYESTFSRGKMDCGEATDFVHKIHLMDEKPFRLPYRRVAPCHYDKVRTVLNDMELKGIIRKSQSEYASPLVLVWKKNGDLRLCTDFRWLNAKTVKDAHPLPHQSDALAALGGNVFFSTMDLTSGFYNVPLFEEQWKYTDFSSPFGLHEYNRLPQGLTNSPATFMRMMMSIFGDENFTSLLCYLDNLILLQELCYLKYLLVRKSHVRLLFLPTASPTSLHLPSEDPSVAIPFSRLSSLQEQDNILGRVIDYVLRRKRSSKSERAKEPRSVTYTLKHWKKLKIHNHVLYRVKRDRLMNRKLLQYVVPDSLKLDVLRGVHDAAGNQRSPRTLSLAAERLFWLGMNKDIKLYVKNCQRCAVGKTPEPDARAPLEPIRPQSLWSLSVLIFGVLNKLQERSSMS